jgi:glutamate N-acetyltransferase/amino-acid N-acetyltransferase
MKPAAPASKELSLPRGFSFSATAAGLKASRRLDLCLIAAQPGTTAAALFTRNRVVAAPVSVGRAHLASTGGRTRAVIVNSGNANCATGQPGIRDCQRICRALARHLGVETEEVFPSSTGIIGVPMPVDKVIAALGELSRRRQSSVRAMNRLAKAILTTDTRAKTAISQFDAGNGTVHVAGVAKGSGMIHPQLATMLVYVFTDIACGARRLGELLREAARDSFNCMSVDGDTSTNDTVLLLASGGSGVSFAGRARAPFRRALAEVCQSLADQIVSDGEGAQHVIRLHIEQARTRGQALQVARAIAHSLLVKTAWAGADPNWGRILAAVGACGLAIEPERIDIYIGGQRVCHRGVGCRFDEKRAHRDLAQASCDVRVRLGQGGAGVRFQTTDLSAEYVRINADYST